MKRFLLTIIISFFGCMAFLCAQLPSGSTAPDFTETDINGITHNLYSILDGEQVVFLDFSATWCGPCWSYHNTNAFKDVVSNHGQHVQAFMIEGDANTNVACLYGPSGCNNSTYGNWVAGTNYPIIDASNLPGPYAVNYYPTIYGVCPDKKIYEVGQVGANALWAFAQGCSAPSMEVLMQTNVDCYGGSNGAISLQIEGGISPITYEWSNGETTENISNLAAGFYTVTATGSLGGTNILGPIQIMEPSAPVESSPAAVLAAGCGFGGSIELSTSGGTPGYDWNWNTGQQGPAVFNLPPGSYSVTTTDLNGCEHILSDIIIDPPSTPTAAASAPSNLDCETFSIFLDGTGSTIGPDIEYQWLTSDGNIVSGANTLNNCLIDAAGTYELFVTNVVSSCLETAAVTVIADVEAPEVEASAPNELDCTTASVILSGIGSAVGSDIEYLWTTNDGNIVSGATTLTPTVDEEGTYTLTVTNNANGCASDESTTLEANTTPPNASATGGELNCVASSVEIQANSTTPGATYSWEGPNGFNSTEQNPEVEVAGTYTLTVTDPDNGCTETVTATVSSNTTPPNAEADGGTITCANANISLSGNSTTSGVTYNWSGPNGFSSNEQNPSVSETGTYTLTVTGPNGCIETDIANVNQDITGPTADAGDNAALNCNASSVILNGSGSSSGSQYSYAWSTTNGNIVSGANTLTPTVDEAGDYTLLVTNNDNGCESTDAAVVSNTPGVEASISAQTNVDCAGGSNGSATALGSGGNGTLTYEWSNGASSQTVNGLGAGTYTVVVTDEDDCTATESVTITEPADLVVSASATAQTAPNVNDGTASATPSGGTGNYSYEWSNGETTAMITGLAPGNYTVIVTDANGCTESQTVTVNAFGCAVTATITGEDVSCLGEEDGTASITLNNAAPPNIYEWSNGETTQSISGLAPGNYSVTATDENGCEIVSSVEIGEPLELNTNATSTGVTSAGAEDGTATASPTGGTGPYSYEWSNGETTATITGLPSANYTVTVTDANGCISQQTVPVAPFGCSAVASISASNISCFGENDGQATVTLPNGLPPFTYDWSNGETTATVTNLAPGTYTVEVIDAVNCPSIAEVTIVEPVVLEANAAVLSNADCGAANGSATVEATGGSGNHTYEWSNGETTQTISGLEGGIYTVSVTDENNCLATMEIEITVDDNESPTVVTQDITVEIGNNGTADIQPEDINNGSSDNCAIASMTVDVSSFGCDNLGQQEVTLTVVDEAGNSSSGSAVVTVMDMTAPEISVQNITISLDENGQAMITPDMLDDGSFDNCGIAAMSIDMNSFSCDDIGSNAVVLTVEDDAGNSSSGTAVVNVVDDMAPLTDCPDNMVLPYCDPVGEYSVSATDNCSDDLIYQWPADYPSGSTFPNGETELEVIVSDGNGNSTTCNFIVQVPEAMAIEGDILNVSCFGESDGSITALPTGGAMGYTYEWNNGANTATINDLPPGDYNVIVTDEAGCSETQSYVVDEPAELSTDVVSLTNETLNNQDGAIDITPIGGVAPYTFEWTDENGNFVSDEEDIEGLSAGNYSVEIEDANGCTSVHDFTIQSIVSVIDYEMARKIKLYPNPTTGLVTMELEDINAPVADIMVFDVTGKMALSQPQAAIATGQYQFDMSESASGVYIVRILIENSVVTKRLMVGH
ncbi:MAG: T9SS type A sorting domain-containing protein [Bacteroidota bacterium]